MSQAADVDVTKVNPAIFGEGATGMEKWESAWVIVCDSGTGALLYYATRELDYRLGHWTEGQSRPMAREVLWTVDHTLAVRFARKEDAEAIICIGVSMAGVPARAEEHLWL